MNPGPPRRTPDRDGQRARPGGGREGGDHRALDGLDHVDAGEVLQQLVGLATRKVQGAAKGHAGHASRPLTGQALGHLNGPLDQGFVGGEVGRGGGDLGGEAVEGGARELSLAPAPLDAVHVVDRVTDQEGVATVGHGGATQGGADLRVADPVGVLGQDGADFLLDALAPGADAGIVHVWADVDAHIPAVDAEQALLVHGGEDGAAGTEAGLEGETTDGLVELTHGDAVQ